LALAHPDGSISFYDLPSGRPLLRLAAGPVPSHMAFDLTGRRLALACPDFARVRDFETGQAQDFHHPRGNWPYGGWHPDSKTLAASGGDRVIYLWDVVTGKEVNTLRGFKNHGIHFAFNRAGDLLAGNGWEGILHLWDPRTGVELFHTPMTQQDLH